MTLPFAVQIWYANLSHPSEILNLQVVAYN